MASSRSVAPPCFTNATSRNRAAPTADDALASSAFGALRGAGVGLSTLAWAALPAAAGWLAVSFWLGRASARMQSK